MEDLDSVVIVPATVAAKRQALTTTTRPHRQPRVEHGTKVWDANRGFTGPYVITILLLTEVKQGRERCVNFVQVTDR